jgi:hypothetical protein
MVGFESTGGHQDAVLAGCRDWFRVTEASLGSQKKGFGPWAFARGMV